MKAVDFLLTQLDYTYRSISLNLNGVNEKEAIEWPASGGNCINWITGHIINSRISIMDLLDLSWSFSAELNCYRRGVNAKKEQSNFLALRELKQMLKNSQTTIVEKLKKDTPPDDLLDDITRLLFHEAYHAGQIGLLRRVIGKEGQIK